VRIKVRSEGAHAGYIVTAIFRDADQQVRAESYSVALTASAEDSTKYLSAPASDLLAFNLTCAASAAAQPIITASVAVTLLVAGAERAIATLVSGPLGGLSPLVWQENAYPSIYRDQPIPGTITTSQPAAGAEHSITISGGPFLALHAARFQLVTSADVANRTIRLLSRHGGMTIAAAGATAAHVASENKAYIWLAGVRTERVSAVTTFLPDPPPTLPQGATIFTETTNIQAADQWQTGILSGLIVPPMPW
jgi:hypothetical protein